jgi:hypothetical protein
MSITWLKPGQTVSLELLRGDKKVVVLVQLKYREQ